MKKHEKSFKEVKEVKEPSRDRYLNLCKLTWTQCFSLLCDAPSVSGELESY